MKAIEKYILKVNAKVKEKALRFRFLVFLLCVAYPAPENMFHIFHNSVVKFYGVFQSFIFFISPGQTCVCIKSPHTNPSLYQFRYVAGYASEAEEAFHWLRGYSDQAQGELKVILSKKPASRSDSKEGSFKRLAHSLRSIFSLSFLKPFFIMNVFFFVQQFSGVNAVAFYSVDIMKTVSGNVDEYLATIVIDVIRVVMSLATCILLRQFGRRPLGLISLVGTTVSLLSLAAVLKTPFYKEYPSLSWLPTGLLASYICFISIGLVPLPWVMTGEVRHNFN